MLVSTQSLVSIIKSQSLFAYLMSACLVASLPLTGGESSGAQTLPQSVTVEPDLHRSDLSAGANGAARIDDPSEHSAAVETESSFNSPSLPEAPSAPRSILMPQTPTAETFTETNSDGSIGTETVRLPGDGSQAVGTFATQNPFVRQPGQTTVPANSSSGQPVLPPITQNGLRGDSSSTNHQVSPNPAVQPAAQSSIPTFGNPPQSTFEDQTRRPFGNRLPEQTFENPPQPSFGNQSRQSFGQPQQAAEYSSQPTSRSSIPQIQNMTDQAAGNLPEPPKFGGFKALPVDRSIPIDNQVKPTGYNQLPNRQGNPNDPALQLLSRYEVDNAPSPLPGRPTSLLEMMRQPISASQRRMMVSQYWETYYDWATFLSRAEQLSWLNSIASPSSPADQALLRAAKSAAGNQVLAAEIQLGKSQSRLTDFLPSGQSDLLPLPSDKPLVQKYKTNYELYRQHGMIPTRLRGIDGMLPKTLNLIQNRAETVQLARVAADDARKSLATRQTSLASVLEAARIWRAAEQDLVATVTSYNKAIADYSLSIAQRNQTPEQIVGMLIAKPKASVNADPYRRSAQQPRSSISQYSQPSSGQSPSSKRSGFGQQPTGNFGPTVGNGSANQSFGQTISQPAGGQAFGSGSPVNRAASNVVSPANSTGSAFNSSPNRQSFGGSPQNPPPRAANSQFNQFGR